MTGLLSLPSELLDAIIQTCSRRDRSHLRSTCKILQEHADPVVFQRLRLSYLPRVLEHQIVSLVTRSSRACELAKDVEIIWIPDHISTSALSWSHFGDCDDLRVHLPTAISMLRNTICFRWVNGRKDPDWLTHSIAQAVASLPRLSELVVRTLHDEKPRIPLGLFSNLTSLSVAVECDRTRNVSFYISQIAIAVANSPQLTSLHWSLPRGSSPPRLSELFAKLSAKNPLHLEHLHVGSMDATLDGVTLPHLTQFKSFDFYCWDILVVRSTWSSFLVNNVKLTNVVLFGLVTEETMSYLSSFSGLERLVLSHTDSPSDETRNVLFEEVIPKHATSLQTLVIVNDSKFVLTQAGIKSIVKCLELRELHVSINNSMTMQFLLDTFARLPELLALRCFTVNKLGALIELANFKASQGAQYVENLEIDRNRFVFEKDGERPMRYRFVDPM